jgi:hypothetical protein
VAGAPRQTPAQATVDHPSKARGIRTVRLGDPDPAAAARSRTLFGDDLHLAFERATTSGVTAVELDAPGAPGGAVTIA